MGKYYPEVKLVYAIRGNKCKSSLLSTAMGLENGNSSTVKMYLTAKSFRNLPPSDRSVFAEPFSAARHQAAGAGRYRHARNHAGLVHETEVHWPKEDQGVCAGWGRRHDRHTGSPGPQHPHTEVRIKYRHCGAACQCWSEDSHHRLSPVKAASLTFVCPSTPGWCSQAARCCSSRPRLKSRCGISRGASCPTPISSSWRGRRKRWTPSSSTTCCATARRRSSRPCVTSTEPSLSLRPWSSAMWVQPPDQTQWAQNRPQRHSMLCRAYCWHFIIGILE